MSAGTSRRAARSSGSGAVMKVGQVRRDTGLEQGFACPAIPVGVGLEQVDSGESVHLEIDEARNGDAVPVRRRQAVAGHAARRATRRRLERAVRRPAQLRLRASCAKRQSDVLPRGVELRTGLADVDLGEQRDDRDLGVAVRRRERSSTCSGEAPVAAPTMRRTRARSFSFVAETSTMRLPKVLPSRIIESSRA